MRHKLRQFFRGLLGVLFVAQGINHFIMDEWMIRMIPDYLPAPALMVYLSGVAEIVLGILVFVPRARRLAGWGILALLVAVFPANLEMALHPEQWPISENVLWGRLPFQLVFAYWAWATCIAPEHLQNDQKGAAT
ncbi:MAG: DoxX family protein [Nannocystaceae bacterium]